MISLLRLLDTVEDDVEADLQLHYGIDYRDRFRTDEVTGRPVLTLRRVAVLLSRIPRHESKVVEALLGHRPWSREAAMLDEVRRTQLATHGVRNPKPHPDRVHKTRADEAAIERRRKLTKARQERRRKELREMADG